MADSINHNNSRSTPPPPPPPAGLRKESSVADQRDAHEFPEIGGKGYRRRQGLVAIFALDGIASSELDLLKDWTVSASALLQTSAWCGKSWGSGCGKCICCLSTMPSILITP